MASSRRLFLDFLEKGLVYRKNAVVNWDPVDMTVLANEQVENGRGWRSGALVERRELTQWFFKISDYSEELLSALDGLENWPAKVRLMQENWIGKSRGLQFGFKRTDGGEDITVYTTRPDTLMGASFVGISPDHPIAKQLEAESAEVAAFVAECRKGGTTEEAIETGEKLGLDTGIRVTHPLDPNWELPVWIANFILMDYGTGAIFACPAHDQRDFEFATKYDLPIIPVFEDPNAEGPLTEAYVPTKAEKVRYVKGFAGSAEQTGEEGVNTAVDKAEAEGWGEGVTKFRLRDWGLSPVSATGAARFRSSTVTTVASCPRRKKTCRSPCPMTKMASRSTSPCPATRWIVTRLLARLQMPLLWQTGETRNRHDGHVCRFVLVFRPLHRAQGRHAHRSGGCQLLDERRPVHRRD